MSEQSAQSAPTTTARISADGKAVFLSDGDPEDALLVTLARDTATYAEELLAQPMAPAEMRYTIQALVRSVRDMIGIVESATDSAE